MAGDFSVTVPTLALVLPLLLVALVAWLFAGRWLLARLVARIDAHYEERIARLSSSEGAPT